MAKISKAERHSYAKLRSAADMPNLLDVQLQSFDDFLQLRLNKNEIIKISDVQS